MPKNFNLFVCTLFIIAAFSVPLYSQSELPSAEKIIANYVAKTGGLEKYKAIKNAKISGEMSIPAANIKGKLDIVLVMPNRFHFKVDLGALGTQERGSDGKVVWENSTVQGARLIKGDEAEQLLQEISMGSLLNPKKYFTEMKTVGKEQVNGEECYVVALTRKKGSVDKEFYSVESGLKLKTVKTVDSPLGKITVESFDSNYKMSENGVSTAWTGQQKIGPNSIFMKMSSVQFNVDDLKDWSFDLPEEVKDLIGE